MSNHNLTQYIKSVLDFQKKDVKEHTYRTPLETLLQALQFPNINAKVIHEGKDDELELDGTPDFFIYKDYNTLFKTLVGFIECKKISYNLEALIKSEQIQKYSKTSENIIITNYREFILLRNGGVVKKVCLIDENLQEITNQNKFQDFENLLLDFYNYDYEYINNKTSLSNTLASISFYYSVALREYIKKEERKSEPFWIKFSQLCSDFGNSVGIKYALEEFCDIYSQSFVYGLFIARFENDAKLDEVKRDYLSILPSDYRLLSEFLEGGYSERITPLEIKVVLTQIGKNLNLVNIEAIKEEFAKDNQKNNSIVVYLYEEFLKKYDDLRATENRKENGVYYTPWEATNFIVRACNDILTEEFETKGLKERGVKILDFACGTGTFLDGVLDILLPKEIDDLEKVKIKEKVTQDLYGFELLFTPYIVAHTVLIKRLKDAGIKLGNERLGIYLTNTLDIDSNHGISAHLPELKMEDEKATNIKDNEGILAIIGNPPYRNGKSDTLSQNIENLIKDTYKKGLSEKKVNLDDLYIKFIKFAEWKITKQGSGVVGIITNNSFLDGITHRKMREELMKSFDDIYILNLHGKTAQRGGGSDKNIFGIQVGVSINIFVKHKKPKKEKQVKYFSILEADCINKAQKLEFLLAKGLKSIPWKTLKPAKPNFWFVEKDETGLKKYNKFKGIKEIFENAGSGNKTERDYITMHYKKNTLDKVLQDFKTFYPEKIAEIYKPKKSRTKKLENSRDWTIEKAKEDIINNIGKNLYIKVLFRAFNERITFFTGKSRGFIGTPSKIGKQMIGTKNIGLCFERSCGRQFKNVFVTNKMADCHAIGSFTYLAPLYIYGEETKKEGTEQMNFGQEVQKHNFTASFVEYFEKLYSKKIGKDVTPKQILGYIYAVLHSTSYRTNYLEFLKSDFPKVPFTEDFATFEKYSTLGKKLVKLHTMEDIEGDGSIKCTNAEEKFVIKNTIFEEPKLLIETKENEIITFEGVSKNIMEFEIGAYSPIQSWLDDRKLDEVELETEDLQYLKNMIIAIKETLETIESIDELGESYID